MAGRWARCAVVLVGLAALTVGIGPTGAKAQGADDLAALNREVVGLYRAGKYAEAIGVAERLLARAERQFGPDHAAVGTALNNLAELYRAQGRYVEAEPFFKRALAVWETALGPDHPEVGTGLNNLAGLYRAQGRLGEAEPLYRRALAITEKALGPDHADVGTSLNNLAGLYHAQGRLGEAEPLYRRALAITEKALGPDHPAVGTALNNLAELYRAQGRLGEVEPLHKRALAIAEKALGPDHPDVGTRLNNLAALYHVQGRLGEAEPLYRRALAIAEKALGPDHPDVGARLNNLAELYRAQGWYTEAETLFKRALAITETTLGPDHPEVGTRLNNLALLYHDQGRYTEAEPLFNRALAIAETALGPDHADVGIWLNNLAELYRAQGRYAEAEPLFKRALAITEKALGPDHPDVGTALNNLAELYRAQGRYTEAEPFYKRALAITETALGPDHPEVGTRLNNLAVLYRAQGRHTEAEPLFNRALAIAEKALGPDHPDVGARLNNLAELYRAQGRYTEAEPFYKRALAITETALGPNHPDVGTQLNNLALLYHDQGRYAEAEPLFKRALAIREKALGPSHPDVGQSLNNLAALYWVQGRYSEAEPLFKRALANAETALGPDHPDVGARLNNLAVHYFAESDWARAAQFWRRSTAVTVRRARRGSDDVGQLLTGQRKGEAERESYRFSGLVKLLHRLAEQDREAHPNLARETFQAAQWAHGSEAAKSLAQMAARGAKGDAALGHLIRERQDLVAEWQRRDADRIAAVSQAPDRRDRATEAANEARLSAIDTRIGEIDQRLRSEFPDYAALSRPEPLSVEQVQAQLRPDEALVLFLDAPELKPAPDETFIWVVTKSEMRWLRSDLGTEALRDHVGALRCGLDQTAWHGQAGDRCIRLLDIKAGQVPIGDDPLPFDLARAHALYEGLFGQVEDLIKDRHLLIVPSGPLTQLPFHVLVAARPDASTVGENAYRRAQWLAKRNAITVLPAVSSLKALREHAKTSRATQPLIGFGNPLLDGSDEKLARLARDRQHCPKSVLQRVAGRLMAGAKALTRRGGQVDVADIRAQVPLPEAADELCAVARDLKVPETDVRLGARATERELKAMSEAGRLAAYRIVHFATHATLAGELSPEAEPGLILTPPETGSAEDDGYLTASEVAGLKLDADWVILSACNTAAGGAQGAEALSGLARAFFYAGTRALLVSHWKVYSDSTVKLITRALSAIASDKSVGRSEALRRSMTAMIEWGTTNETHPARWAPFIVVGEGAGPASRAFSP